MRVSHIPPLLMAALASAQTPTFTTIPAFTTMAKTTSRTARGWMGLALKTASPYVTQTIPWATQESNGYPPGILDQADNSSSSDVSTSSSVATPSGLNLSPRPVLHVLPPASPNAQESPRNAPPDQEIPSNTPVMVAHAIAPQISSIQEAPRKAPLEPTPVALSSPSSGTQESPREAPLEQDEALERDTSSPPDQNTSTVRFWIGNIFCTLMCPTEQLSQANLTAA